jgi:hypothetical protein
VPIVPVYYHKKTRSIVVGKPQSVAPLFDRGLDREGVAEYFKNEINSLYREHFKDK